MDRVILEGDAAIEQEAADLIDQRRAAMHQAVPHPMHRLQVELLLRLDGDEAHVLLGHGFGDRLGIDEVVLVRLAIGLHELRGNEPYFVSLLAQSAGEKMRSAAGLDADQR